MDVINIEFKARCTDPDKIRGLLTSMDAQFEGTDHQTDTYFTTPQGRLKLREGTIETNLIFYYRENVSGPKKSDCILYSPGDSEALKKILEHSKATRTVVRKEREIWYLGNIKIHIDRLDELGSFVEIEAKQEGDLSEEDLHGQCQDLLREFGITDEDLVAESYSDMIRMNDL